MDLLNFSGSAEDMMNLLKGSGDGDKKKDGLEMAEKAAQRVAAAEPSKQPAACGDPNCTHDHSHSDHDHSHDHKDECGHDHDHSHDHKDECGHDQGHDHDHKDECGHDHDHGHDHKDECGHDQGHDHHKDGHEHAKKRAKTSHSNGGHDHTSHGHTHEHLDHPGKFEARDTANRPRRSNFEERAFTVGIGGPVGSGKTALMLQLCRSIKEKKSVAVVTNDIFTREDGEFLTKHKALDANRIRAVETGGCPHAAIREDVSANLLACEELTAEHGAELLLVESGGDNLAANFSHELADYTIYVIDVAGGDKVPRKGGPGITQSDLLIINKTDLADAVGADLKVMDRDAKIMRGAGPTVFSQVKHGVELGTIVDHILSALASTKN